MHRHSTSDHGLRLSSESSPQNVPLQYLVFSPQSATSSGRDWPSSPQDMKGDGARTERAHLLGDPVDVEEYEDSPQDDLTTLQLIGLYTSHGLSMWNSRSYEFASVLFAASAYPNTLTVASIRGLSANLASLLFSPALGRWCNQYPSRLWTLQVCIVAQRICICVAW